MISFNPILNALFIMLTRIRNLGFWLSGLFMEKQKASTKSPTYHRCKKHLYAQVKNATTMEEVGLAWYSWLEFQFLLQYDKRTAGFLARMEKRLNEKEATILKKNRKAINQ